ncbi:hypothetical protein ACPCSP_31835 [Streptomyces cinereoruber]|uniref:hypothetical protein n=1 Tax=Streptomyces cinereoruber TaxID=67260 RepID=UPI003C3088AB
MDKDANELAVMTEAEAKCRGQLPAAAPEPTVTVLALFLTEAKALSACVRKNGFPRALTLVRLREA